VDVASATIALQPSAPDALAQIDLGVRLVARSRADHEVALDRVTLEQSSTAFAMDLAIAGFTPFWIHSSESAEVNLANAGTTNAELASLCGETATVFVYLDYPDTITGMKEQGGWSQTAVAIACP
jgi:hypothetical protein